MQLAGLLPLQYHECTVLAGPGLDGSIVTAISVSLSVLF